MVKKQVNTLSGVVLGVTLITAVVILSVNDADKNSATVVTILGIISMLVLQTIGNSRSSDAADKADNVDHKISNGLIPEKVRDALTSDEGKAAIRSAVKDDTDR